MNVPKLRFKEFNDKYNITKMNEIIDVIDGDRGNNYPKANDFYDSEFCLFLNAGNVTKNGFNFKNNQFITKEKDKKLRKGKLLINDIVLTTRGTVGNVAWLNEKIPYRNIRINSGMVINRIKEDGYLLPEYLYSYMKSPIFENQVNKMNYGSAQPQLTVSGINKFNIQYPTINEQKKVSTIMLLLDKKIELQAKKIEDLKLFKSSKYSLVFSKFNNKIKLSDICKIEKGKQINSELLIEKGDYYMLNGGILPSGFLNEYNTNENTITISEGGNSCGYVNFNKTKFWCGGHCYKIISSSVNTSYLYHLLKHNEKTIMDLRVGSGLPNIQKKDLEVLKLSIHENDEQLKIGILFDTFDKKINLETNKLNKFKKLKKGLMQQMFV